jgi:hypothetical protein
MEENRNTAAGLADQTAAGPLRPGRLAARDSH